MDAAEAKFNRFFHSIGKSVKDMKEKIGKQTLQADVMQQKLGRCDVWANNKIEELKGDLGPIRAKTTKAIFQATVCIANMYEHFQSQQPAPELGQTTDNDIEMELAMQLDMMVGCRALGVAGYGTGGSSGCFPCGPSGPCSGYTPRGRIP